MLRENEHLTLRERNPVMKKGPKFVLFLEFSFSHPFLICSPFSFVLSFSFPSFFFLDYFYLLVCEMGKIEFLLALVAVSACVLAGDIKLRAESSGQCGENITWTMNSDYEYVINGTGPLTSCNIYFWNAKKITINGVSSIGNEMFQSGSNLISVVIGDSVENIGQSAFASCSSLINVSIEGENLALIADNAFYYCYNLKDINIPNSVRTIGNNSFDYTNVNNPHFQIN